MKRLRRVHPLYWLALVLFIAALVASALTADTSGGVSRSASVYDAGPGGTAALRKYLEAMGAFTMTVQGDTFTADPSQIGVLFMLGPSEQFTQLDALAVRRFVMAGGTAVLASDSGLVESALLDTFDIHVAGPLGPGRYPIGGVTFADPPTHEIAIDRGITFSLGTGRVPLAAASGQAFDEYHHGVHPSTDVLVLLTRTWPGRAMLFAGIAFFVYLVATGRRLGAAIPLDARPPRSSLEYIRGFAGLVRRSGHGEIARRRFQRELRSALTRELGLDPETPIGDIVAEIATTDRERAARVRSLDDALSRPLREDALLRTVREIGLVTASAPESGGRA